MIVETADEKHSLSTVNNNILVVFSIGFCDHYAFNTSSVQCFMCKCPLTEPLSLYRVRVLPRSGLRKVEAKGLFVDARVFRGRDWKWKDQDGKHKLHKVHSVHRHYAIIPTQVVLVALVRWYQL